MMTADAIDLLASRLRTPLQVEWHLTQALESGYQPGESLVGAELVEAVLSKHLDDIADLDRFRSIAINSGRKMH